MQPFDKYTDLQLIGEGSFGQVYRAVDTALDRMVAIKFLRPGLVGTDSGAVMRFNQEGKKIARINHPNVITVHDVGQIEGVPFIVMEWVDGFTLIQRIQ